MRERYSEPNRSLRAAIRHEVQCLHHDYVGTEHLLLGMTRARPSLARDVLEALAVDPEVIRAEVERRLLPGSAPTPAGQLPFTPRMRDVLNAALEECETAGDPTIDTAHLLVALVRIGEGVAGSVLFDLGLTEDAVRARSRELRAIEPEAAGPTVGHPDDLEDLRARLTTCEQALNDLRSQLERLARRLDGFPEEGGGTEAPGDAAR